MLHNLASFQCVNLSIIRHGCQSIASLITKKRASVLACVCVRMCACVQTHNKLLSMHTRLSLCINLPQARLSAAHNICMYLSIYMYLCIYILIRAFKNNTIYSALPPPLLLVLFFAGCVLYLKHAQQLKVFFTQIEFAPRTNVPSPSRYRPRPRPAAQALSLLLLPSQLTSPSSSLLLALPILLPVIGRCH